jgi:hypothetical protein
VAGDWRTIAGEPIVRGLFNHYSFVWITLTVVTLAAAATWRVRRRWLRLAIPSTLVAAALIAFFALRTGAGNVRSVADLDRALAGGKPVLLELYSDF